MSAKVIIRDEGRAAVGVVMQMRKSLADKEGHAEGRQEGEVTDTVSRSARTKVDKREKI